MGSMAPGPSQPVQAKRSPAKVLLIVGLVLALVIAASVFTIYIGVRILSHNVSVREVHSAGGGKEVAISTPVGNLDIHHGASADPALLGLPVYPGAKRMADDGNASVRASFANQRLVGVLAAKFETPDSISKVRDFYHNQLNGLATRFVEKNSDGGSVFEIKSPDQEKIVALKPEWYGTRIELVKIIFGKNVSN
jgi:hypothetical protein